MKSSRFARPSKPDTRRRISKLALRRRPAVKVLTGKNCDTYGSASKSCACLPVSINYSVRHLATKFDAYGEDGDDAECIAYMRLIHDELGSA